MPLTITRRCAGITPSATLAIDAKAKALKAQGERVIGFAAGEPDFPTPEHICDAAREAISLGMTRYTPASGTLELKKAVCRKFETDNGLVYSPEEIIVSSGAKQSLLHAFMAVVDPGDEVIIPAPCWLSYPEMVRMAGGIPIYIHTTEAAGFLPTLAQFKAALSPRTRAILINSPSNPTGAIFPVALLSEIAAFAVDHGLCVVSDEIYEQLIYDGMSHTSIATLGDAIRAQTLVVNGVSKTYAMTGWRIGYTAGPKHFIKAMTAYQSHASSNPNSIAQHAATKALTGDQACVKEMRKAFDARRKYMVERISKIPGLSCIVPHGAFYVMLNCQALLGKSYEGVRIESALHLADILLDAARVALVPGEPFEAPGFCRLSYAISREDIEAGLSAIEAFIGKLV